MDKSDLNLNYLLESSETHVFSDETPHLSEEKSCMVQARGLCLDINKPEGPSRCLAEKRCASKEPVVFLQQSPKRAKLLSSIRISDKASRPMDQLELKPHTSPYDIPASLPGSDNSIYSESFGNQENVNSASFCSTRPPISFGVSKSGVDLPLYTLASSAYTKITDLLTEQSPNGSFVNPQAGGKIANSTDAQSSNNSSPYVCSKCSKIFRTKLLLTHHLETHDPSKGHRCSFPDCERAFRSQKYLDNHVNDCHRASSTFNCPYSQCKFVGNKRTDLKRHVACNHKSPSLPQNPNLIPSGTSRNATRERLSDEFFDDAEEVMSRNLKEIYESLSKKSPVYNSLEVNSTAVNGDHFSPDETSSTVSAPSFSNGGCVAGPALTPPLGNLPCPSPLSYPHVLSQQQLLIGPVANQWHYQDTSSSIAVGTDLSIGVQPPYILPQSSFGSGYSDFPPEVNCVRCSPLNKCESSFQSNGVCNYGAQYTYGPRLGSEKSNSLPQIQQPYHHPPAQSATSMSYLPYERQSLNSFPFTLRGSTYDQFTPPVSVSACYQDDSQQPCCVPQQSVHQEPFPRQKHCSHIDLQHRVTIQMTDVPQWSSELSTYSSVSRQMYDAPPLGPSATARLSGAAYYQPMGQPRRLEGTMNAPGVFQAAVVATPPPCNSLGY